jgi:hypothetical protein
MYSNIWGLAVRVDGGRPMPGVGELQVNTCTPVLHKQSGNSRIKLFYFLF